MKTQREILAYHPLPPWRKALKDTWTRLQPGALINSHLAENREDLECLQWVQAKGNFLRRDRFTLGVEDPAEASARGSNQGTYPAIAA